MNRLSLTAAAAVLYLLTVSCSEESPFMTKEEASNLIEETNTARDPFHYITNVAAIINNDIYYFDRLDSIPRRLTNTPTEVKTYVKLSHDNSQIAYLDADAFPVIISASNGKLVETLTDYQYAPHFDWAKDRNTLYIIYNNEVHTHGEAMTVPQPKITYSFPWDNVLSYSMNAIGDHAYYVKEYAGGFYPVLSFYSESKNISKHGQNVGDRSYDYVDFYDNKGGMLVGWNDTYEGGIGRVACVKDYNFWPAYTWDYEAMRSPEFNGDLEVLLYGLVEEPPYQIKAVYLGTDLYDQHGLYDVLSKTFTTFTSNTPIYLDWNH